MTFETAMIFFISLVLLWIKPGPGQALKLAYALQYGFGSAFSVALGVLTICLSYFLFVALGYNAIAANFLPLFIVLKFLGAFYLLYLGVTGFLKRKKRKVPNVVQGADEKQSFFKNYGLGLLMALSNPITIFYFVGVLPALVPVGELSNQDLFIGLALIALAGMLVDGLLILLTVFAKEAFSGGRFFEHLGMVTSVSLILIGLFLLYSAIFLPEGITFDFI